MMGFIRNFVDDIKKTLDDKPATYKWCYVAFRDKATKEHFTGAVIVYVATSGLMIKAMDAADAYMPTDSTYGDIVDFPADRVPPEEYRNRLLNREEVIAMTGEV